MQTRTLHERLQDELGRHTQFANEEGRPLGFCHVPDTDEMYWKYGRTLCGTYDQEEEWILYMLYGRSRNLLLLFATDAAEEWNPDHEYYRGLVKMLEQKRFLAERRILNEMPGLIDLVEMNRWRDGLTALTPHYRWERRFGGDRYLEWVDIARRALEREEQAKQQIQLGNDQ